MRRRMRPCEGARGYSAESKVIGLTGRRPGMSVTRPADLTAAAPSGSMADRGVCGRRTGLGAAERCVAGVTERFILGLSLVG